MNKLKVFIWIVVLVSIIVAVKIFYFSPKTEGFPPAGKNGVQKSVVTAFVVNPENITNTIFATGTILANEEVQLVPEASGKVTDINFTEGTSVSKGSLLVKINDADLQAQLKKLSVQEKLASDNEARDKAMFAINGISQMQYDATLAQLNSVKADIAVVQSQIAKTEIKAPFAGVIGLKYISPGAYVSPSSKIALLTQVDKVKIDFSIPEKYSSMIKTGDTIQFSTDGREGDFYASVIAIEPKIDAASRALQVRAITSNKGGLLLPGSFAKINLSLQVTANGVMIPTEAVIPILNGEKVFVSKNGKAEEVNIKTGLRTDSTVQILKGLYPGDTVITSGIMQLKSGSALKITSVK